MKSFTPAPSFANSRAFFASLLTCLMLLAPLAPFHVAAVNTLQQGQAKSGGRHKKEASPAKAEPERKSPGGDMSQPTMKAPPVVTPLATTLTATKTDNIPLSSGVAPGQPITYTVTITNSGAEAATNVSFNDTLAPHTTLTGAISATPLANDDAYNVVGNVRIQPSVAQGVLLNDAVNEAAISGFGQTANTANSTAPGGSITTTDGGTATLNADGSFSYDPAPGFTGTDEIFYTLTNSAGTNTAQVTFTVAGMIFFVNDDDPVAGGDGRLTNPFNCLVGAGCFSASTADEVGDTIFLYQGAYTGGLTLLDNQKLIGQGASNATTLAAIAGVTVPAYSDPLPALNNTPGLVTITTSAATTNAINIAAAASNTLRGFTVGNTTGAKIASAVSPPAAAFGTLTVSEVALNGTGQALNLDNGTLAATFTSIASTNATGQGINLDQIAGSLTSTGGTSITNPTTQCLLVSGSTAIMDFGNTTCSDATDGISLQNNSAGTRTFGTLTVSGSNTGSAFLHSGGGGNTTVNNLATLASGASNTIDIQNLVAGTTVNFAGGATLAKTAANNAGVNVNTSNGSVTFAGTLSIGTAGARFPTTAVNITGGTGTFSLGTVSIFTNGFTGISTTTDGTLNTTGGTVDVNAAPALNIAGPAGITTLGITLGTVNSTGGTNNVNVTNAGGTLAMTGGALSGASGASFVVSGSNPTVSFGGTVTQNNAGRVVDIQGTTGNSVSFSNTVTGGASSLGVHIGDTTTVNGNVTFSTLNLGTVGGRMTNQAVTITSGASGATYALGTFAIFTNNASGLVATNFDGTLNCNAASTVDTTNATAINIDGPAGLTSLGMTLVSVNSAGGTADGISIQDTNGGFSVVGDNSNTTAGGNATGGTISGKNGADGSTTSGIGVYLNNVTNITLRRIRVNGVNQNFGIRGLAVNNFTLEYSTVGSTTPTNSGTIAANLQGTLNTGIGEGAVYFGSQTDGVLGLTGVGTFTSNFISAGRYDNMQVSNGGGSLNRLNITGSTFGYNFVGTPQANAALTVIARRATTGSSTVNSTVTGNTFVGSPGNAANFTGVEPTATQSVAMDTIFQNNTISNNHANNNIGGSNLTIAGFSSTTFNASSNTMTGANGSAITLQMGAPVAGSTVATSFSGTLNNNTIGTAGVLGSGSSGSGNGIFLSLADNATAPKGQATIAITNNQIHGYSGNFGISADNTANTGGAYNVDLTITGNTTDTPSGTSFGGIGLTAGAPPPSNNDIDVCAVVTGNNFSAGDPTNSNDIIVGGGSDANSTIRLPGLADTSLSGAATFLKNNNLNPATTAVSTYSDRPGNVSPFIGGAACSMPPTMANFAARPGEIVHPAPTQDIPQYYSNVTPSAPQEAVTLAQPGTETTATEEPMTQQRAKWSDGFNFPYLSADSAAVAVMHSRASIHKPDSQRVYHDWQNQDVSWIMTSQELAHIIRKPAQAEPVAPAKVNPVYPFFANFPISIGTIPAGDSVTITFTVTVNANIPSNVTSISNQGQVSGTNFTSPISTNDPETTTANDATITNIQPIELFIRDAKVAEPATGEADMLFTVALSAPAPAGGVTYQIDTADGGSANPATGGNCQSGNDYVIIGGGNRSFAAGEQFKVIGITVCSDTNSGETDETFLVNVSNIVGAQGSDIQATGTITPTSAPGRVLISELRTSGPGGAGDDFIELYNNQDVSQDISGWGLFKSGASCLATPVVVAVIPAAATIPPRGHYLIVGPQYSLAAAASGNPTVAAVSDIESNRNLGLFNTSNLLNLSTTTREDAVGFDTNAGGGNNCDLLREGASLISVGSSISEFSFTRNFITGLPKETNDNAADFLLVTTTPAVAVGNNLTPALGAPGPENLASPVQRNAVIKASLIDPMVATTAPPNRVRSGIIQPGAPNAFGTLSIQRRFKNTLGVPVTRLRFRVVDITTINNRPPGSADLRVLSSNGQVRNSAGTLLITVNGLTLEAPPQPNGGGLNSTLTVIPPGGALAAGATIDVQFLLGVQEQGNFSFFVNVEALPAPAGAPPAPPGAGGAGSNLKNNSIGKQSSVGAGGAVITNEQ